MALVATASRRHIAWCALFALLLALLHVLPLLIFRTPPYPNFLALYEAPLELFGRNTWVILLPALIPAVTWVYTLFAEDRRPVVAEDEETHPSLTS